jgi:arsenate reductase (thioredoxin)
MSDRKLNVLFLCTGNAARSVIAEVLLNSIAPKRFHAYSAGSHPKGTVSPFALELLERNRMPTAGLRSKSWDEFAAPGATEMDFVFTVCDQAAGEACPVWPGQPITAHWGVEDLAAVAGTDEQKRKAFVRTFAQLQHRLTIFASLPLDKLDRLGLEKRLDEIGKLREKGE